MDLGIGYTSKLVRVSQKITIEELHEEMVKLLPITIEDIEAYEDKSFYEPQNGLTIADFNGIYFKALLNMVNEAGADMYEYAELWKKREEVLRTFVIEEDLFGELKRYVNTVKSGSIVEDDKEVYEQMEDFEGYFQEMIIFDMGANRYAEA
ncbi:hypothetical protein [Paenibacillus odorifer]|uniref:hypothetical protein n=1 Tax=Paenibacillus odorifer TaxID=189426 RepID=UPI00096F60FD|nr:hypothetical protein [Paenibacillus odorifer]OMD78243.1 hypothetical protein BSK50_10875 [Paenibacillus odorifer]